MNYVCSEDCVSCPTEDGVALLDLQSNTYFSLDPIGAVIWEQLSEPSSVEHLTAAVLREYDADPDVCRRDISDLLSDLVTHKLVRTV